MLKRTPCGTIGSITIMYETGIFGAGLFVPGIPLLSSNYFIFGMLSRCGSPIVVDQQLTLWNSSSGSQCKSSVYDFFHPRDTPKPWATVVWALGHTPKHSFLLWLAAQDSLKTKDYLLHLSINTSCCFCVAHPETAAHLFFSCTFKAKVWVPIK